MSEQAHGTSTAGSTSAAVHYCSKRRNYFVTFWNQSDLQQNLPEKAQYYVQCEDSCKDGKWHAHCFIYFKNPTAFSTVQKMFSSKCDIKVPLRNSWCIDYVKGIRTGGKELRKHNIVEFGTMPMDNGCKRTVAELKNIENPDELEWNQFNTWQKVKAMPKKIKVSDWKKPIEVHYFWNPHSGKGKTLAIVNWMKEHNIEEFEEIKHIGEFWHGIVDGTGCAVYDDFRPSHMIASEFVNFIDYNIHSLNVKNGSVQNRYNIILISSIINPTKLYKNMSEEDRQQWLRRLDIHTIDPESVLEDTIEEIPESDSDN